MCCHALGFGEVSLKKRPMGRDKDLLRHGQGWGKDSEEVGVGSGDTAPKGFEFGLDQQNHCEFVTHAAEFAGLLVWARCQARVLVTGDSSVS